MEYYWSGDIISVDGRDNKRPHFDTGDSCSLPVSLTSCSLLASVLSLAVFVINLQSFSTTRVLLEKKGRGICCDSFVTYLNLRSYEIVSIPLTSLIHCYEAVNDTVIDNFDFAKIKVSVS